MAKNQDVVPKEVTATAVERELTSQGETWCFTDTNKVFKIHQSEAEGYQTLGYSAGYPVVVKNADNTVSVLTKYRNLKSGKIVTITDTITNYNAELHTFKYKYSDVQDFVLPVYERKATSGEYALVSGGSVMGTNKTDIYKAKDTSGKINVYDEAGDDRYAIENHTGNNIITVDVKGNDNYDINNGAKIFSRDYSGNDKYNFKATVTSANATDFAGKDTYTYQTVENGDIQVDDYNGNDKYILNSADLKATSKITDYAGNDKYTVTDSNKVKIIDGAGNDKYTFSNVDNAGASAGSYHIADSSGNDKYTINNNSRAIKLQDGAGKDTWTVAKTTNIIIKDIAGNDKYALTETTGTSVDETEGDDKYTVLNTTSTTITDIHGDDKYAITNGRGTTISDTNGYDSYKFSIDKTYVAPTDLTATLTITDKAGKDSFTISGIAPKKKQEATYVKNVKIKDEGVVAIGAKADSANDTYKLSYVDNTAFGDDDYAIDDTFGNDKFAISNSEEIQIKDNGGNDTYDYTNSTNGRIDDNAVSLATDDKTQYEKNTYNIKNSSVGIYTNGVNTTDGGITITGNHISNDTYNVTAGAGHIYDYDNGDDEYNYKNLKGKILSTINYGGNDTYKINNSEATFSIVDNNGDDCYTITKSTFTAKNTLTKTVADRGGEDEYTVTNSKDIVIEDDALTLIGAEEKEKNTFNIKNSTDFRITVNDGYNSENPQKTMSSKDTYNITSSSGIITDNDKQGDVYKFDKLNKKVSIFDNGGSDELIISSGKQKNIVFLADALTDGGKLYIYDKANKGYVQVNSSYVVKDNKFDQLGVGTLETVKLGSGNKAKSLTVTTMNQFNSDTLKTALVAFHTKAGAEYDTIEKVLDSGNKTMINELIACFDANNLV